MPGNTFGRSFCVTTFGESHGPALGCVIDGCPPGLALGASDIQSELDKRKPGKNKLVSQRKEADKVEILSGVYSGYTTGVPIALLIKNQDARSSDYEKLKDIFRPGHGDYSYHKKYGIRDHRGGGRASARETVARVAAGAIAKKYLQENYKTSIMAYVSRVGEIEAESFNAASAKQAPYFFADASKLECLDEYITTIKEAGDSVGAKLECLISNVPVGLGEPVFDKLDACLAYGLMSINAVKGVEIGVGFACCSMLGSAMRDAMSTQGFASNNAGGILAGISTGEDITVGVAFKPTSSIKSPITTVDKTNKEHVISVTGRHDPCVGIRAVTIVEAMVALVLLDQVILYRGQTGKG